MVSVEVQRGSQSTSIARFASQRKEHTLFGVIVDGWAVNGKKMGSDRTPDGESEG